MAAPVRELAVSPRHTVPGREGLLKKCCVDPERHRDSLASLLQSAFLLFSWTALPLSLSASYPESSSSQFEPFSTRELIFNGFYSMVDKSVGERQGAGNA